MPVLSKTNRDQIQFLSWETFIAADHPVRVIDAFVDYFDLSALGFEHKGKSHEGRPAFGCDVLLKLYIYGYLNRIRSSRQLAKACSCNVELFWLLHQSHPCYKTIADFRKDNTKALRDMFRQFNAFLKGEGLLQSDTVAIDSVKIGAQNSKKNNYNEKKVKQHLTYLDQQVDQYLRELTQLDQEEQTEEEQILEVAQKLDQLIERKKKYEGLKEDLKEARSKGETQVSTSDPDARALPKKMNIVEVAYNIQTSVEADDKLITNFEVTNKNDTNALSSAAIEAKRVLGKDKLKALADKGYDTGIEHQICDENGIETYVAPRQKNTSKKHPDYVKEKFVYDPDLDSYQCPAGQELKTNGNQYKKNSTDYRKVYRVKVYKLPFEICNSCSHKLDCAGAANLKNSKGRPIERSEYEDVLEANRERVRLNKEFYRKRQQIVEHPFGTIKRQWGYHYTLMKTKKKVEAEMSLIFTCYNLRRSMSIFGVKDLIKRLKSAFLEMVGFTALVKPDSSLFSVSLCSSSQQINVS
jgi:transposase